MEHDRTTNTRGRSKELLEVRRGAARHWVGDGFPVRTLFSYPSLGRELSPFLLLDHAGPTEFPPTSARLGVGEHPHKGFETVTIVYAGEVEHRDSAGGGGLIGAGDVQWMTAGSGIVHEELHGREFAARGGPFEMVQLWVNLPAADKLVAPRYQGIRDRDVPSVPLPDGAGRARVIAGSYGDTTGPAETFTPVDVWDLRIEAGRPFEPAVPDGRTTALVVLRGSVEVNGSTRVGADEVAVFGRTGETLRLEAGAPTTALLLGGEPIDEPIVGRGPFVMNDERELEAAAREFLSGGMGRLGERPAARG